MTHHNGKGHIYIVVMVEIANFESQRTKFEATPKLRDVKCILA